MKRSRLIKASWVLALVLVLGFVGFIPEVLAADAAGSWRSKYDLVMRYLNFLILAFVLIKFGKNPLMNALRQRKEEIQKEIKKAEEQRKEAEAKANELRRQLEENVAQLEQIKQKIINRGETRKKEIIQEARAESKILLLEAKRRIDSQIISTKKMFQAEMVDEAMKTVFEKLPQHITQADNQKFLDQYITQISSE
jgi:F-type H+-transporting ATPase subunit b